MRSVFTSTLVCVVLFGALAAYGQFVANSRYLSRSATVLRDWSHALPEPSEYERLKLVGQAARRAMLYDDEIVRTHLVDGMLVNWSTSGRMLDQCDSLLFSSLRFVALTKLGLTERAARAWRAIEKSSDEGNWPRHPRCPKFTSRDMLIGLLVALSQQPPGYLEHLDVFLKHVERNGGYFSNGPFYVSYMSPGIAKLVGLVALANGKRPGDLPEIVRTGYSTTEVSAMGVKRGYAAHLVAMSTWLELELDARSGVKGHGDLGERFFAAATRPFAPFRDDRDRVRRLEWSTHKLVQLDGANLFFRYLRLRASNAMTPAVAHRMLEELLAMKGFPEDRLPMNCDRRADYLWQRASREFAPTNRCTAYYNGADFLWMAALLVEAAQYTGD